MRITYSWREIMRCRTNIWVALVAVVIAAILDAPLAAADGPKEDRGWCVVRHDELSGQRPRQ